ncbi:trans-aconitate 2-methyltransferase [Roseateles sp. DAIF2]|uniref:class I SAM-dependent methyltransferase n=1 Tax=Roseateles sp. DAIF2 TaxID=2714952 RepID=UPI00201D4B09|nr:class I SAM-dependent methyltransferase [Roseateles sp. DAIF2]
MSLLLTWPLPALFSWGAAWLLFMGLTPPLGALPALLLAALAGLALSLLQTQRWRRLIVAAGFPASLLASGLGAALPAWVWLLPLALLALAYPQRSWRDAPLFPTPAGALDELAAIAPLPEGAPVLDAGCGLGHGLRALRRAYPRARLEGVEWSPLLARLAAWSCPWARVWRGDMWAADWRAYRMVYLFQRPESMPQALAKARAELGSGCWLVSLDFELEGCEPLTRLPAGRHELWVYRWP